MGGSELCHLKHPEESTFFPPLPEHLPIITEAFVLFKITPSGRVSCNQRWMVCAMVDSSEPANLQIVAMRLKCKDQSHSALSRHWRRTHSHSSAYISIHSLCVHSTFVLVGWWVYSRGRLMAGSRSLTSNLVTEYKYVMFSILCFLGFWQLPWKLPEKVLLEGAIPQV